MRLTLLGIAQSLLHFVLRDVEASFGTHWLSLNSALLESGSDLSP